MLWKYGDGGNRLLLWHDKLGDGENISNWKCIEKY
jgi:hypothetical protein